MQTAYVGQATSTEHPRDMAPGNQNPRFHTHGADASCYKQSTSLYHLAEPGADATLMLSGRAWHVGGNN